MKNKLYMLLVALMLCSVPIVSSCSCSNKVKVLVDYGNNEYQTIEIDPNSVVDQPETPTKIGYIFDGWFADSGFSTPFDWNTRVDEDITIFAKWTKTYNITIPNADMAANGYSIDIRGSNTVREGTIVDVVLRLADGYSDSAFQVFANDTILTHTTSEAMDGYTEYIFAVTINADTAIRVTNIESNTYSITFPSIEGVTIDRLDYIGIDHVIHGDQVRFRVNVSSGYSKDNIVVTANGTRLLDNDGVYTISHITSNQLIEITGIERIIYSTGVWDGDQYITANGDNEYVADKFVISDVTGDLQYGDSCSFVIASSEQKYSQFDYTTPGVIRVLMSGNVVPATVTKQTGSTNIPSYLVQIDNQVSGNIRIEIDSELIIANTYTVSVPNTTVEQDGYKIVLTKYTKNGVATNISDNNTIEISYGEQIWASVIVDEDNYNSSSLELYTDSEYKQYVGQEVYFTIYSDTVIALRGLSMKYYNISTILPQGAEIVTINGYDATKTYYKDVMVGDVIVDAKTIRFSINTLLGYEKTANFAVKYYYNITDLHTINDDNGVYTISDISGDITIAVSGVEPKDYEVVLPVIDGASVTFDNGSTSTSAKYGTALLVNIMVEAGYSDSLSKVELICSKGLLTNRQVDGYKISYELKNFVDNISSADWTIVGLEKNKYNINFGTASNYTLQDSDGKTIGNTLVVEHGDNITIDIIKANGYSQDDDYEVVINGEPYTRSGDKITLTNIVGNISISITGIDTLDTYRIDFLDTDGSVLSYTDAIYGTIIDLPQYTNVPQHYQFDSWHWATKDNEDNIVIGEAVATGEVARSNGSIVAVLKPIDYYITFDLSNAEQWIDSISNINNINTADGRLKWNIEDVASEDYEWKNEGLSTQFYTFYRWVLAEDITIAGVDYPAGTVVDRLTASLLGSFTLKGEWVITVGAGNNNNHSTIAEAIKSASKTNIDTIVLTGYQYNEGNIVINNSVKIITNGQTANITYSGVGALSNGNYSMFLISPNTGAIDVTLQNININFTCTSRLYEPATVNSEEKYYSAVAINCNNTNLTLSNVTINGKANGVLYQSSGNSSLTMVGTSDTKIIVNNDNSSDIATRDYGVKVISSGNNVNVNISSYTFWCNGYAGEYKGVWLSGHNSANVTIDNVKFSNARTDSSEAMAIYLETEQSIALNNVGVNVGTWAYRPWSYGLVLGYTQAASASTGVSDVDNYLKGIARDVVTANNNQFVECVAFRARINYLSDNIDAMVMTDSVSNIEYRIDYRTSVQLANLITLGFEMNYVGTDDIDLSNVDLTIANGQVLNFGNERNQYNIICGNLINNGRINYVDTITASSINNVGDLTAATVVSNAINNTGAIDLDTYTIAETGVVNNSGTLNIDNLTINGTLTNSGVISGRDLLNNGTLDITSDSSVEMWYVTNNGNISNSGTIDGIFNLINNEGGIITNEDGGLLSYSYISSVNNGQIINNGTITQQTNDILLNSGYGVNNSGLALDLVDGTYVLSGVSIKADDDSQVAAMYPNGSGYYVALMVYVDLIKAGQSVEINFTRTENDGASYTYVTKMAIDTLSANGSLDILIDLNMVDDVAQLSSIAIAVDGKNYVINIDGVVASA